jgi:ketosteroid isomerase-like protein
MTALALLGLLAATGPSDVTASLRARDQRLLDAVAIGDRAAWDEALAPDAVYVDENWIVHSREELLKELVPLPKGVTGAIAIREYEAVVSGDVATVVHRDEETENYFGTDLHAAYLTTETWVRRGGEWKLALVHAAAVNADPPERRMPADELDAYVGDYTSGTELRYVIRRRGDHLEGGASEARLAPLKVELRDVLFVPGRPRSRKIFERDERGKVSGFVDRREGQDVRWRRGR